MGTPEAAGEEEQRRSASGELHFDVAVAFVARRVYRRLRQGARSRPGPALLGLFDEQCFDGLAPLLARPTQRALLAWCGTWPCLSLLSLGPRVVDIFRFLHGFATWCALPTDVLLAALVYMDRLLDTPEFGRGILTARSWRPVLTVCLLLASKMWEDWCIGNREVSEFLGLACESLLCWEVAAMQLLSWDLSISADLYATYFWAVKRAMEEGRDEQVGRITDPLSGAERAQLARMAAELPELLTAWRRESWGPAAGADLEACTLDDLRRGVESLPSPIREKFVFAKRLEDRYKFLGTLGSGSFGEVKLAVRWDDSAGANVYAVKVFEHAPRSWVRSSRLLTKSFVLSGISASLDHPNVVRFLEFVVDEARFLRGREQSVIPCMEVLRGPDMFDWLAQRQAAFATGSRRWISRHDVAHIVRQVSRGLAYIHGNRPFIVHRDVKPENLRWSSTSPAADLKLVDFGTVFVEGSEDAMAGQVVGTALFMAPEAFDPCCASRPAPAPALDMFSLGVVLFLLLCGRFPHEDGGRREHPCDSGATPWHLVPPEALGLLRSLLATEPSRRLSPRGLLQHPFLQAPRGAEDAAAAAPHPPASSVECLRNLSAIATGSASVV